ncbi:MAG: hypothetical protein K8963_09305, partial [Proteobacteria bacterium]|nr:hypothetical protein [Pseudomonadota bacterium]
MNVKKRKIIIDSIKINVVPYRAAFHGFLLVSPLQKYKDNNKEAIAFAKYISECFERHWVVDMFERKDPLNLVRKDLENYMYDNLKEKLGWPIPPSDMDDIQEGVLRIAQNRMQK